jgi:hypothetical protein
MTTKKTVAFLAVCVLSACGGGSAPGSGTTTARQGSHPDQGTAAPHIECGASAGHHGGGCGDGTSGGAASADGATTEGAAPAETTTTTTTTP